MNEYTPQFLEICAINTNRNWDFRKGSFLKEWGRFLGKRLYAGKDMTQTVQKPQRCRRFFIRLLEIVKGLVYNGE